VPNEALDRPRGDHLSPEPPVAEPASAARGGAENRSERTQRCVSEERRLQQRDAPPARRLPFARSPADEPPREGEDARRDRQLDGIADHERSEARSDRVSRPLVQ